MLKHQGSMHLSLCWIVLTSYCKHHRHLCAWIPCTSACGGVHTLPIMRVLDTRMPVSHAPQPMVECTHFQLQGSRTLKHQGSMHISLHTSYCKHPRHSCASVACTLASSGVYTLPTMSVLDAHAPVSHAPQPMVECTHFLL